MDKIIIRDLALRTFIGVDESEQEKKQDVVLNLVLSVDLRAAGQSDRLEDTVNYRTLKHAIVAAVEGGRFHLLEYLAEQVAALTLLDVRIRKVEVTVDKPGVLRYARSVAVVIERT